MTEVTDPAGATSGSHRSIASAYVAQRTVESGGLEVFRPFPTIDLDAVDPFLLLDELGPVEHAPGAAVGAPAHPHRGFEIVSYVIDGTSVHEDSLGKRVELGPGDVQLLTAGSGVVHEESPSAALVRDGGRAHSFQIWVNIAAARKMMAPAYTHVPAADVPVLRPSDGVAIRLVAGALDGTTGAVSTSTQTVIAHVHMQPGASVALPMPADRPVAAYVFSGVCCRDGATPGDSPDAYGERRLVVFADDGDTVGFAVPADAATPAEFLFLAGVPLGEPIARRGPYVMTDRRQLRDAEADFAAGHFGCLVQVGTDVDADVGADASPDEP